MQLLTIVLTLALAAGAATAQDSEPRELASITTSLEREIEKTLDETGIPSISLALIRDGQVVWASAHGYANVGARVPATVDTYYSTGSTFKFVTATAIMQLVERGELTLDTPVNEIVGPDLAIEGADDVTVRHLLSHHSGLYGEIAWVLLWSRQAPMTPAELLSKTLRIGLPGTEFKYRNVNYAIAGYIVEVVSGQTFDEYVAEHVLQPLGVDIDQPSIPSPEVMEHMALPYNLSGGAPTAIAQVRGDAFAAGDIYLKASDMARFVAAQLNGGEYQGERILSEASTEEMRRQQFEDRAYGLGVQMASFRGHDIINHGGGIPGFKSIMVADPSTRQGVYIMANANAANPTEADRAAMGAIGELARHAMQLMWGDDFEPLASPATEIEVTLSPDLLDEYVGEYAFTPVLSFTVSRVGDRLFVKPTGQSRLEVFASSETDFFLKTGKATLTFGRAEAGGPVTHLILHKLSGDQRANRVAEESPIPEGLPEAVTLFARHLEARGGRQALEQAKTIAVTSKVAIAAIGLEGTSLSRFGRNLRFTSTTDMGARGTTRQGYDGKVGWSITPQTGAEVLEGAQLERLKRDANWWADAEYERLYSEMQTVAREDFHGFDCFVVQVTSPAGDKSKIYFEQETGLVRGRDGMWATGARPIQIITVIRSYGEFGGLQVPTRTEVIVPARGFGPVATVEAVEYDTLDMSVFELPPEIVEKIGR